MPTLYKNILIAVIILAPILFIVYKFNHLNNELNTSKKMIVELHEVIIKKETEIGILNSKVLAQNKAIQVLADENKLINENKDKAYIKIEQLKKDSALKIQKIQDKKSDSGDACADANKLFDEFNQ